MLQDMLQISKRIKEIRDINGISIETLSKEFNIPVDQCKKYESGDMDIPVSYLFQLANKFNIELTALITGEDPKLKLFSVIRNGKGLSVNRRKEYSYQDLAYNFIGKKSEVFMVTVDPKDETQPVMSYSHPGQEFNYVLEGTLKVKIENYDIVLEKGDCLYFDSGNKHGMSALNGQPAQFLSFIL